jgi:hypothetical protein
VRDETRTRKSRGHRCGIDPDLGPCHCTFPPAPALHKHWGGTTQGRSRAKTFVRRWNLKDGMPTVEDSLSTRWVRDSQQICEYGDQQLLWPSSNTKQCTPRATLHLLKPSSVVGPVLVVLAQCAVLFLNRLQQFASSRCSLQSLILIQAGTQDTQVSFCGQPQPNATWALNWRRPRPPPAWSRQFPGAGRAEIASP